MRKIPGDARFKATPGTHPVLILTQPFKLGEGKEVLERFWNPSSESPARKR
jgi:hypothetical protein